MSRIPQALGVVGPRTASKGQLCKFAQFFYLGEAAALLRVSWRTVAHAARVLSEDSPAAPAVRLAVEQGRVTVSDASKVIDEPTGVQLRALERVTGGGSRNLAGAARRVNDETSLGPGPGPSDWLAVPKGDAFQHSQNSARRSITPPCQNRGPMKDERKTPRIGPVSVASVADANNLSTQRRVLADCEQVF